MGAFLEVNWTPVIPGELTDTKIDWRWFKSDKPFFNPFTDQTQLDVLSDNEVETLKYNTAIYQFLPISVFFDFAMFWIWLLLGIAWKVTT